MTRRRSAPTALITGGAGFVATNVASRLLDDGWHVRLFDNLSRAGVEQNLEWLQKTYRHRVQFAYGDVRDGSALQAAVAGVERVFHFAAQVAVTTSLNDPIDDFEINARGTLNLLEAIRALDRRPTLLFTSTNKVYGHLDDVPLGRRGRRYEPRDEIIARHGVSETRPLDFHSPYGCSKGAAEQYVLDYARTYGLPATVFRMSCIYGPHQFGTEDQGWVAHFLIQAMSGRPLTLYGDGLQVRDILFVDDLVDAMMLAHDAIEEVSGEAFNVGGGPGNTISLLELIDLIAEIAGERPAYAIEPWRPADQRYYVSNTTKLQRALGWKPRVGVREGIDRLAGWLAESMPAPRAALAAGKVAS